MKHRLAIAAGLAAALVGVAACGGDDDGGDEGGTQNKTITVWTMDGSVPEEVADALNEEFEAQHEGVTVKYEIQDWNGIQERLTTALASNDPPAVIELGNTQTSKYAASGGLLDLSDKVSDLGGQDWYPSQAEAGKFDGKQYGIPFYTSSRVVAYRTDMFDQAGVQPPTTREEWLSATQTLNEANADNDKFQGIYLPGQNWYVLSGFIWDEGGDLAVQEGEAWKGALDTPEAMAGMQFYKELQSLSKAPPDVDEANPLQFEVFAEGQVAQMIALPWEIASATDAAPDLEDKIDVFPIPGETADQTGAVFAGGSHLAVPAGTQEPELGYDWLKMLAGEKYQQELAKANGNTPNKPQHASVLEGNKIALTVAESAVNGNVTPVTPTWAAVETAPNPLKSYMTAAINADNFDQHAKDASQQVTDRMASGG